MGGLSNPRVLAMQLTKVTIDHFTKGHHKSNKAIIDITWVTSTEGEERRHTTRAKRQGNCHSHIGRDKIDRTTLPHL